MIDDEIYGYDNVDILRMDLKLKKPDIYKIYEEVKCMESKYVYIGSSEKVLEVPK